MVLPVWAAVGLLACEYLVLNVAFESHPLTRRADGWVAAGYLGWLAVPAVSVAIGTVLALYVERSRVQPLLAPSRVDARALLLLGAHAVSYAALWGLSAHILSHAGPPAGSPVVWLGLWGAAALATTISALGAALPWTRLRALWAVASPAMGAGVLIGLGAWVAGQASAYLWWPLGPWTVRTAAGALSVLLTDPVFDPAQQLIGSEAFRVVVAPVCSGFEGVGLMTVFVGAYLVLARRQLRFPQALLLLPLGLAAAWAANVLRLVLLVLVGTYVSAEVAAGGFHARAGWVFFCALALSLVLLVQRVRFFTSAPVEGSLASPTAAYLLPFLLLVATSLVTGLLTAHVDVLYAARIVAALVPLVAFRRYYRDIRWAWSWTAVVGGLAAAAVFMALAPPVGPADLDAWHEEWQALPPWVRGGWIVARALGSVLVVPIAEELAFRGYLLRRLVARDFWTVAPGTFSLPALVLSSVAFGAIHTDWLGGALAGLAFGLVQIRTRSIGQAILSHVVANAVVAVAVLAFGQWWLWE